MNSIIPFKKNIVFKTKINEITDISLSHDYKILSDMIEGEFYLSGTYKMTEASLINEEFYYNIPFSIALSDRINKDTINLKIDNFDYKIDDDIFLININLNLEAEEVDDRANNEELDINETIDKNIEEVINNNATLEETVKEDNSINNLISNVEDNKSYITYKVHIFREGDSIESISEKYSVSVNDIEEYNDITNINIGDKILVPFVYNE